MTPTDLLSLISRLEGLAEKATPGPWENFCGFVRSRADGNTYSNGNVTIQTSCQWVAECRDGEAFYNPDGNATYIAATDPTTIKTLCAALRQRIERETVVRDIANKLILAYGAAYAAQGLSPDDSPLLTEARFVMNGLAQKDTTP